MGFQEIYEDGEPLLSLSTKIDEDFNVYKVECMTLEDADTILNTKRELSTFLRKLIQMERKKNDTKRKE